MLPVETYICPAFVCRNNQGNNALYFNFLLTVTCNTDRNQFKAIWTDFAPFAVRQNGINNPSGIIPTLLELALRSSFGPCETLNKTPSISYREYGSEGSSYSKNIEDMKRSLNSNISFTFPLSKPRLEDPNFKYIEIVEIPGAAIIEAASTGENAGQNVDMATSAMMGEIIIFFVMCWLAGVIIWILVSPGIIVLAS